MKVKLGDVCERGSSNLKQSDVLDKTGGFPIYGASGYIGNVDFYHQERPYVAIVKDGAGIGRAMLLPEKSSVIGTMQYLLPKENILPKYLYYVIRYMHLEKYFTGATIPHIYFRDYKNEEFECESLERQAQIIDALEKTENIISARYQQLQQLEDLVKARFVELMNNNPSCNLLSDFIVSYKAERCGERDLPILSITKDNGIVLQNEKFKKRIASTDASTYKVVPRGKLVQGIHIDERNFAIQNIVDEGIVSPAYKIWTVDTTKAVPEVLAFALRTDRTMAYISSKFTGSIKRRESISISDFMATPIDLPNMNIQKQFADFVKQVDKSKFIKINYN